MDVRDIVLRSVPTVEVQASLREVAAIMAEHAGSAVLVVDEKGKVLGVITEAVLASALSRVIERANQREPLGAVQVSIRRRVIPSLGSLGAATEGSCTPRTIPEERDRSILGRQDRGHIELVSLELSRPQPRGSSWVKAPRGREAKRQCAR
jgi:hypothetical protein